MVTSEAPSLLCSGDTAPSLLCSGDTAPLLLRPSGTGGGARLDPRPAPEPSVCAPPTGVCARYRAFNSGPPPHFPCQDLLRLESVPAEDTGEVLHLPQYFPQSSSLRCPHPLFLLSAVGTPGASLPTTTTCPTSSVHTFDSAAAYSNHNSECATVHPHQRVVVCLQGRSAPAATTAQEGRHHAASG